MSELLGYDSLFLLRRKDPSRDISLLSENKKLFWVTERELIIEMAGKNFNSPEELSLIRSQIQNVIFPQNDPSNKAFYVSL